MCSVIEEVLCDGEEVWLTEFPLYLCMKGTDGLAKLARLKLRLNIDLGLYRCKAMPRDAKPD